LHPEILRKTFGLWIIFLLLTGAMACASEGKGWVIHPSIKYDALCFVQAIGPDPMYSRFYEKERAFWRSRLSSEALKALNALPVSASHACLIASKTDAASIDDLIAFFSDPAAFLAKHSGHLASEERQTICQDVAGWGGKMVSILQELQEKGFISYWQKEIRPRVEEWVRNMNGRLKKYDIARYIGQVESFLGEERLKGPKEARVWVAYFARPLAFVLDQSNEIVVSVVPDTPRKEKQMVATVVHELLHRFHHPPALDRSYQDLVQKDDFYRESRAILHAIWLEGDEEQYVAAADAFLARRLGLRDENETLQYLLSQNGGTLTLATVLYQALLTRKPKTSYGSFLAELFQQGSVTPGQLEEQYQKSLQKLLGKSGYEKWMERRRKETDPLRALALQALDQWLSFVQQGQITASYALCSEHVKRLLPFSPSRNTSR